MKFTPTIKALAAAMSLSAFSAYAASGIGYFEYPYGDFNDRSQLQINDNSKNPTVLPQDGSSLLLTDRENFQARSVFRTEAIPLSNNYEFKTKFAFRIDRPNAEHGMQDQDIRNDGADGIVFVIQTNSNTAGSAGGGIGYYGIDNSIGIEFDTWGNDNPNGSIIDANGNTIAIDESKYDLVNGTVSHNHVGINLNGDPESVDISHISTPFNSEFIGHADSIDTSQYNGVPLTPTSLEIVDNKAWLTRDWWAWIDYDGTTLEVRLAPALAGEPEPAKPVSALLTRVINLESQLGLDSTNQDAFIGFTSATGGEVNRHEIMYWEFGNTYHDKNDILPPTCGKPITNGGVIAEIQDDPYEEANPTAGNTDLNNNNFQDIVSGLASINLLNVDNIKFDSAPSFTVGTTDMVDVTVSLIDSTVQGEATLEVTDDKGNTCTKDIKIGGDALPTAIAYVYPAGPAVTTSISVNVGEQFTLDASDSEDVGGNIDSWTWDVDSSDGDDSNDEVGEIATHTFNTPGTYTITLTVTDGSDQSQKDTVTVTVSNDGPSVNALVHSANKPTPSSSIDAVVGEVLSLDGSDSSDTETPNSSLVFEWQAVSNGTYVDTSTAKTDITFTAIGTYTVTLNVTDGNDQTGSDSVTINIINQPPVADAKVQSTAMATPETSASIKLGETVQFIGSGSSDLEDDIDGLTLTYDWKVTDTITGDVISTSSGESTSYDFDQAGDFAVTLTVTDSDGANATATAKVIVIAEFPPVANIKVTAKNTDDKDLDNKSETTGEYHFKVNQGQTVNLSLSGSDSTDKDGVIIEYNWSGDLLTVGKEGSIISGALTEQTDYEVSLTVTDDDGYTHQAKVMITISINQAPEPVIPVITIPPGTNVTIDPNDDSIIMEEGNKILLDASRSTDPDAQLGDKLQYEWWTTDEDGKPLELVSTSSVYEHTASSGSKQLILKLTDADGATSTTTFTVKSYEPSYTASGSMGSYLFTLLLLVLIRRKFIRS